MAGLAADLVIANPPPADWTFKGGGRCVGGSQERIEMRSVGHRRQRLRHNLSHCSSHIAPPRVFSGRDDDFCTGFSLVICADRSFIWSRNSEFSAWFLSLALAD